MSELENSIEKKRKMDLIESDNFLNEFEFVKVLNEDSRSKLIFIEARKKNAALIENDLINNKEESQSTNQTAVIIFEKPHFSQNEVSSLLEIANPYRVELVNDIYRKQSLFPRPPYNSKLK
jgi:hypothetical protein